MRLAVLVLGMVLCAGSAEAKTRKRRVRTPVSSCVVLRGSPESLERQNKILDDAGIVRMLNDVQLERHIASGELVPLRVRSGVVVDEDHIPERFRFVRVDVLEYLEELGVAFVHDFPGRIIRINSAIRTIVYQQTLRRRNANAAPALGPKASSHLAGATVDIAKKDMTSAEIRWLRNYFCNDERQGSVEATEEFQQAVFHVMVIPKTKEKPPR